jgi:hypothetical protein
MAVRQRQPRGHPRRDSSRRLAFHYCYMPEGQLASKARLIRAAGLRWPVRSVNPARGAKCRTTARNRAVSTHHPFAVTTFPAS